MDESSDNKDKNLTTVQRAAAVLESFRPSPAAITFFTAVMVGVAAGVGAVIFRWLIDYVHAVGFEGGKEALSFLGRYYVIFIPAIGGLIIGPLIFFYPKEAKGHGVPEVMEAVAVHGGKIRAIVVLVRCLASSICIGTGGSVGREGPIVQIGAAVGSTIGRICRLSDERVKNLVACGAAGGIAATFNAPIGGVAFALEVVVGVFNARYLMSVVLAAVAASVIGRAAFGNVPAFVVPSYALVSFMELVMYAILGILAAIVAHMFTKVLYHIEDIFTVWKLPGYFKPAVGGLIVGCIGLSFPGVFGVGYEAIEEVLASGSTAWTMVGLMAFKILATSVTLGSGGSGGIFVPCLFMGAMLGGCFGSLVHSFWPEWTASHGAYALVGMAAVFSAAARAPMSACLVMFELTGHYIVILPLMLASVISTYLAGVFNPESIYTLKLVRRGVRIDRGYNVDVMESVLLGQVMTTQVDTIPADLPLGDVQNAFERTNHHSFPVMDEHGRICGILSIGDLKTALSSPNSAELKAFDIATKDLVTAYPDDTMSTAIRLMAPRDLSRLLVVDRYDNRRLLGVLRRSDLFRAYNIFNMKQKE